MSYEAITPEMLLQAYRAGVFPMAETRHDPNVFWVDPRKRGIIPLDGFHVSRSLARTIRQDRFRVTFDRAFAGIIDGCAAREETWINATIRRLFLALHDTGDAHSVEVWRTGALVGGVYGLAIGGAFFGESMFSTHRDASKVALTYLVDRLRAGGFQLFDTQFVTSHLTSLGAVEIDRLDYRRRLDAALNVPGVFSSEDPPPGQEVTQRMTQTS